jgi:hypothetical protein
VLDLIPTRVAIVACHGPAAALAQLAAGAPGFTGRVATDELWLLGDRSRRESLLGQARAGLPGGLVVDQTDGWAMWTVRGEGGGEVLDRLMLAAVPAGGSGWVQGAIAGVAGKVIAREAALHILVPACLGHHLRDRVVAACADLGVRVAAEEPFRLGEG